MIGTLQINLTSNAQSNFFRIIEESFRQFWKLMENHNGDSGVILEHNTDLWKQFWEIWKNS